MVKSEFCTFTAGKKRLDFFTKTTLIKYAK